MQNARQIIIKTPFGKKKLENFQLWLLLWNRTYCFQKCKLFYMYVSKAIIFSKIVMIYTANAVKTLSCRKWLKLLVTGYSSFIEQCYPPSLTIFSQKKHYNCQIKYFYRFYCCLLTRLMRIVKFNLPKTEKIRIM